MQTIPRSDTRSTLADIRRRLNPKAGRADALAELDELFKGGKAPDPQPDGFLPGELVTMSLTRPTDAFVRWVSGLYMPWLGKSFDRQADTGINILRPAARSQMKVLWRSYEPRVTTNGELEAFPFNTRIAPGEIDPGVDVLKIDYDFDANPSFIIRHILDELVQVDDGMYLEDPVSHSQLVAPDRFLLVAGRINFDLSTSLPPLVDEGALAAYLEDRLPGEGNLLVERHQAGHSNETFFVKRGRQEFVLRRPPLGAFLPTAHDVGREYKVLSALSETQVRVPKTVLHCDDESIIGAPFYLMEKMDGVVIRSDLPETYDSESVGAAIGDELVDALVELHSIDPASCGLSDFGKPTGYLERQLRRWTGQMELTLPLTRPLPDLEAIGRWLNENLPESPQATIVHGDYKLDNVVFSAGPPARLIAILDWEMSTLGDPLADLGWMTSFWREADDGDVGVFAELNRVTTLPGFKRRTDLVERYASKTGRDVTHLGWYQVLAIWKLAILLEGSYARHLAGMTDDPFFAEMEHGVPSLAKRALEVAEA